MQREIKFRAWNTLTQEMYFNIQNHITDDQYAFGRMLQSDRFKIMQFTGGKIFDQELYEDDIIEFEDLLGGTNVGRIIYHDMTFKLVNANGSEIRIWNDGDHDWYSLENIELHLCKHLGNIYENPNLLSS